MGIDLAAEPDAIDIAGSYGALLSMIEVGAGSLLHAFSVPFGGFFLSLNQGFILSRGVKTFRARPCGRFLPLNVSNVAALLKSLSPAGDRLGPMIAISMQGLLYNAGILLFGCNPAGAVLGMMLLSLWSYAQIALYYYLMFGKKLADVFQFHFQEIQTVFPVKAAHVVAAVAGLVLLKIVFGAALGVAAFRLPDRWFEKYRDRILKFYRPPVGRQAKETRGSAMGASLKDLLNPLFVSTFFLMAAFFALSGTPWQEAAFYLIRPLAAGFLIYFLIRIFPARKIAPYLEKTRLRGLSRATAKALEAMRESE